VYIFLQSVYAMTSGVLHLHGMVNMKMRGVLMGDLAHCNPWLRMLIAMAAALLPEFVLRTMTNRISPSQGRLWGEPVRFEQIQNQGVRRKYR
jgi:hypothetical protein